MRNDRLPKPPVQSPICVTMTKVAASPHPPLMPILSQRQVNHSNLLAPTRVVSIQQNSSFADSSVSRNPSATTLASSKLSSRRHSTLLMKAPPRNTWRRRARHMIKYSHASYAGLVYLHSILAAIVGHLILMTLETLDGPANGGSDPTHPNLPSAEVYASLKTFFALVFGVDLVFQCVVARSQRKFWTRPVTWVNVLALLPTLSAVVLRHGLGSMTPANTKTIFRYLTFLELIRTARVLVILRNVDGVKVLRLTLVQCFPPLMITLFFLVTLVMLFATMLFYAVPCYSSSSLCPITDIFNAGYFVMVTVSTVGYGDQVVSTDDGVAILITTGAMIFGSLYLAMPLAIIGMTYETT
ncbi:hypothetical protein As57867_003485, partial [Aphanomyces stellatus]